MTEKYVHLEDDDSLLNMQEFPLRGGPMID